MLTLHHLGHTRDPVTILSPPALCALDPIGPAPVIEVLAEPGANSDYRQARRPASAYAKSQEIGEVA